MLVSSTFDPAMYLAAGACMILVAAGAAIQVAVGAGLSVICGFFLLLWLGAAGGLPMLLGLNLLVSVIATALGGGCIRWADVALASGATAAGCLAASMMPGLPEPVLKGLTACVLLAVALPRPPAPGVLPSEASARAGITGAALLTGALTVWTATPGPITPVAMARAGRSGADIRKSMQLISIVGYGVALASSGLPRFGTVGLGTVAGLIAATLAGTGMGFFLRPRIDPARVVLVIRVVAGAAAILLVASLLK